MGLIQNLFKKKDNSEFKAKFKQAEEDRKIERLLEERSKSANERDLEKRLEQKRQEKIKEELDKLRKEDNKEMWKSKNMILSKGVSILKDERPILKERNIFKGNSNLFSKEHSIKHNTDMGFWK